MNCKPGDLAVFVRSAAGNAGRIVRCVRLADPEEVAHNDFPRWMPMWVTDQEVPTFKGRKVTLATDALLRPIRDPGDDALDETLQWLPVPSRDEVPA